MSALEVPSLVIHGDADLLLSVQAARDTAEAVPGTVLKIIEGMGHDLPHGEA